MRYTGRLADAGSALSVGRRGAAYDNALAETIIGLFKTEVIRRRGPWRHIDAVEFATLAWVDWFNTRRLLEPIGYIPPAEYEERYDEPATVASLTSFALRRSRYGSVPLHSSGAASCPGCVASRSNTAGMLPHLALPDGRIPTLGATRDFPHGLLVACIR